MSKRNGTALDRVIGLVNSVARIPSAARGVNALDPLEFRVGSELIEVAQTAAEKQLTWGAAGRISGRAGSRRFVISKENAAFASIRSDDITPIHLDSTELSAFGPDAAIHRAIYIALPAARAILQVQPQYVTALVLGPRPNPLPIPEIQAFWQKAAWVECDAPSLGLAGQVVSAATLSQIVFITCRGLLCWARTAAELVPLAEQAEAVAHISWLHLAGPK